jgi:mannose-1-phosphate guanylyltransferase
VNWAAILAGGVGSRFWPLSTSKTPKQLLPLAGDTPLLAEAVERLEGLIPPERTLIITGSRQRDAIAELIPQIPVDNVLVEPRAASTGPALTWATHLAGQRDPDACVLSTHADWYIADPKAFRDTADAALKAAVAHDRLITVGVEPTRPDPGFGYIVPGAALDDMTAAVERFVEKPDPAEAADLIGLGALWNSGLFAWTSRRFFEETESLASEIAPGLDALRRGDVREFFAAVTPIAIDVSHLERSRLVAVVPGRFPWDDMGTWPALARVRDTDAMGNVTIGTTFQRDAKGCIAWAADGAIVLDGVQDLVVVRANGVTLVTTAQRASRLKDLVLALPPEIADLPES